MNATELQNRLAARTSKRIRLVITQNRSLWLSMKTLPGGELVIRAHRMFLEAPPAVGEALADWACGRSGQPRRLIRQFINQQSARAQMELPLFASKPRRCTMRTRGQVHDLVELRDTVNRQYFAGRLTCGITWGRRIRHGARRHFTFGTYSHSQNVVRIHPRLDSTEVPRFFIEFIVFHEMLHAALGQQGERGGRRIIHSRQFRAEERKFARYREAIEWEKANLSRFLGSW